MASGSSKSSMPIGKIRDLTPTTRAHPLEVIVTRTWDVQVLGGHLRFYHHGHWRKSTTTTPIFWYRLCTCLDFHLLNRVIKSTAGYQESSLLITSRSFTKIALSAWEILTLLTSAGSTTPPNNVFKAWSSIIYNNGIPRFCIRIGITPYIFWGSDVIRGWWSLLFNLGLIITLTICLSILIQTGQMLYSYADFIVKKL